MKAPVLKIAFVLDDGLDSTDGVQQYVLVLGNWFTGQGHEVHCLVGETNRRDIPNLHSLAKNIHVRFNGNHMTMPLMVHRRALKQVLATHQFDVVHVQMPYSPLLAAAIIRRLPVTTALIGTFHILPNSGLSRLGNRLLARLLSRSLKRFDRIASVSAAAQRFAMEVYGVDSIVVPNALDTARFKPSKTAQAPTAIKKLICLGRLVPRKGCLVLLRALIVLRQRGTTNLRLEVCGKGPLLPDLQEFVKAHDLESMVSFAGFVSETDKPAHYRAADLAVFPSTGGESFGIVLAEAMAAGTLTLAARNPGYESVLAECPEALFEAGSPERLADAIARCIDDPALRRRIFDWQQKRVSTFDMSTVGAQLLAEYRSVLQRRDHS